MSSTLRIALALSLCAFSIAAVAEDWPTYGHDAARSHVSGESLAGDLESAWVHQPRHAPRPAWPPPAKWDGYNKVPHLEPRMVFDRAFHVAAVGDAVYFGSSADDKVTCLDAATGDVRWTFFTEGPVRLAPTVVDDRLYVGSDDGFVYCLEAADGDLVWKHRIGPTDHRVPGNGRIISIWPVRTGIVVADGRAYACAGVFPSETVYLCAMNAANGDELWKTSMEDLPAQGYLLASPTRLYVTTGRERPVVFDIENGKRLYQVAGGGGGTYALLIGDMLMYGPGKQGEVSVHDPGSKDQVASFSGNHMIVHEGRSYLQGGDRLSALDRITYLQLARERNDLVKQRNRVAKQLEKVEKAGKKDDVRKLRGELAKLAEAIDARHKGMKQCTLWDVECAQTTALALAGERLFAGGVAEVKAYDRGSGAESWSAPVTGKALGLAVANGRLFVSTDDGSIHCFTVKGGER